MNDAVAIVLYRCVHVHVVYCPGQVKCLWLLEAQTKRIGKWELAWKKCSNGSGNPVQVPTHDMTKAVGLTCIVA